RGVPHDGAVGAFTSTRARSTATSRFFDQVNTGRPLAKMYSRHCGYHQLKARARCLSQVPLKDAAATHAYPRAQGTTERHDKKRILDRPRVSCLPGTTRPLR